MKLVTIHTDGGCEPNPGPGGWAAVLEMGGHVRELSGGSPATTNNRMEMQAAIEALRALPEPSQVEILHRFAISPQRRLRMAQRLEGAWVENRREAAGEEPGFVAATGHFGRGPHHPLALAQGPRRP